MRVLRLAVVLVATLAMPIGCASEPAPTLEVQLTSPGGDAYTLRVYDESGLVTAGQSAEWRRTGPSDSVIAFPETRQLEVGWLGGACHHAPTLTVIGSTSHLSLTVTNPDDPNWLPFLPIGCPSVGVPLTVTLTLTEPVEQDAVDIEVVY